MMRMIVSTSRGVPRPRFACLIRSAIVLFVCLTGSMLRGEDPLEAARQLTYMDRSAGLEILENAVQKDPQRIDCWLELLRRYRACRELIAECALREALRLNPDSSELHWHRVRRLNLSPALDALTALERLPGNEERLRDAREVMALGLHIHDSWDHRGLTIDWAPRLIATGQWQRAELIVEAALKRDSKDEWFHACRALILAERGDFDEAMAAQRRAGFRQRTFTSHDPYMGLGDLLLSKGKAELAVQSFGDVLPEVVDDRGQRMVLAQAFLVMGDDNRAKKALQKCDLFSRSLLSIANLLRNGKSQEAHEEGKKFFESIPILLHAPRCQFLYRGEAPVSVRAPIREAVTWLRAEFPERKRTLAEHFPLPMQLFTFPGETHSPPAPSSIMIPELRRQLPNATPIEQWRLRNQIAAALRDAKQYDEAAEAHVANALAPIPPNYHLYQGKWIKPAALEWSLCKRRAETTRFFEGNFERIVQARRVIDGYDGSRRRRPPGKVAPTDEEAVSALTKMGPGVLAVVIEAIRPDFSSREDRAPLVRVIESVGGEQDIPVLLSTLAEIVTHPLQQSKSAVDISLEIKNDSLTEESLHQALEKLTGVKNPATSSTERLQFWSSWWEANARRIVLGEGGK